VDYGFVDPGGSANSLVPSPCISNATPGTASYDAQDNKLGIVNTDGTEECFYYANASGTYIGRNHFSASDGGGSTVVLAKGTLPIQILNPPNFRVDNLMFLVRPTKDPYTNAGGLAKFSPAVSIFIKFVSTLPTGEQVPIYYQTSVTSNQYDIPNQ
jgi:hypothetical protein